MVQSGMTKWTFSGSLGHCAEGVKAFLVDKLEKYMLWSGHGEP
jgi:hypothetical protein